MDPLDPDSTVDRDRRVLELLDACLELTPSEVDARLVDVEPGLRAQVRALLGGGELPDAFATPPSNPLEELARETVLQPGAKLGSYEILGPLGEGGTGRVYHARQAAPQREVAVKTLRSNLASADSMARFRVEAELLARLEHPHIARIYEAGIAVVEVQERSQELPFFALEYVRDAATITDWARATGPDQRSLLTTFRQVVDALHHAHQRGVIHRDLKPVNVLVDSSGQPKVIDFGIARAEELELADQVATRLGQILGTPSTMAPEQLLCSGSDLDVRVDVFALGAILYELLCGRPLRELSGISTQAAMRRALLVDPPRPRKLDRDLAPDLEAIVLKAIAPEREDRYPSAEALGDDLRRYLEFETVRARRPQFGHQVALFVRRNRWVSATLAAAVLGLIATTGWAQWNAVRAVRAERAQSAATERAEGLRVASIDASLGFLSEFVVQLEKIPGSVEERVALLGLAAEQLDALEREQTLDAARRSAVALRVVQYAALLGKPGLQNLGRREDSLAAYERALQIADRVEPDDPERARLLRLHVELDLFNFALYDEDPKQIAATVERIEDLFEPFLDEAAPSGLALDGLDSEQADELRGLYQAYLADQFSVHMEAQDQPAAIEVMQRTIRLSDAELAREPGDVFARLNAAMFKSNLSVLLHSQGRDEEALATLKETIAVYEGCLEDGSINPGKMRPRLAEKHILRAEFEGALGLYVDQGKSAAATLEWTVEARAADPGDMHNLTMHFSGLELRGESLAGRAEQALAAGDAEQAHGLFARAVEALEEALDVETLVRENGTLWHPDRESAVAQRLERVRARSAEVGAPGED